MSKMTDEQIIKALECFAIDKDFDDTYCKGCAFECEHLCYENASEGIAKASLYLINRQQKQLDSYSHNVRNMSKDFLVQQKIIQEQRAEIQALREDIHNRKTRENKLRSKIKGFKTEIERLQRLFKQEENSKDSLTKKCYKDGIKEFAERLKGIERWTPTDLYVINNLVKEMVGDDK